MEDYKKLRLEYINNWPNSIPFQAENEYYKLIEEYKRTTNKIIFNPYKYKLFYR